MRQHAERHLAAGHAVVLSVGDRSALVFSAALAQPLLTAFAVRHSCGLLTVTLSQLRARALDLPPVDGGFGGPERSCVTVDAAHGTTTGISAADRTATARRLADPGAGPADLLRPGHMMVTAVDLATAPASMAAEALRLAVRAGSSPVVVHADLTGTDPTTMATAEEAGRFADHHGLAHLVLPGAGGQRTLTLRGASPSRS